MKRKFCDFMEGNDEDGADGGDAKEGGAGRGRYGGFRPSSGGSEKSVSKRKMKDAQVTREIGLAEI